MIDRSLQLILLITTLSFLVYIINMVRNKKLKLRYILIWMLTAIGLLVITIFPNIIYMFSEFLHIVEPVNTLFLIIMFFLILIIFSLTKELSKHYVRIGTLIQELGLIKLEIEEMKKELAQQKKDKE